MGTPGSNTSIAKPASEAEKALGEMTLPELDAAMTGSNKVFAEATARYARVIIENNELRRQNGLLALDVQVTRNFSHRRKCALDTASEWLLPLGNELDEGDKQDWREMMTEVDKCRE